MERRKAWPSINWLTKLRSFFLKRGFSGHDRLVDTLHCALDRYEVDMGEKGMCETVGFK